MNDNTAPKATFGLVDIVKRRRELKAEFEREQKVLKEKYAPKLDVLDKWLLKYLIDNKTKTVATEAGTVMTYKRRNVKVADFDALEQWCEFNGKEEFIKHDVDSTEVLAYLDAADSHLLPDGLKMDTTDVLSVKEPK